MDQVLHGGRRCSVFALVFDNSEPEEERTVFTCSSPGTKRNQSE